MSYKLSVAAFVLVASACNASSSEPPATPPATGAPSASSAPVGPSAANASSRAIHYDLVLTSADPKGTSRSSFSLDLTDGARALVLFDKNVVLPTGGRMDYGTQIKYALSFDRDVPQLATDAEISFPDTTGHLAKTQAHRTSATPIGEPTVVLDAAEGGTTFKLTATATKTAPPEPSTTDAAGAQYSVDVAVAHAGEGAGAAPTMLTLNFDGDSPAIANARANVPLTAGDAGFSARQDVGSRMKATARARGASLVLDYEFESSALENANAAPAARIRKIIARGQVVAPFDKTTTAFVGEEDGHRYTLTVTPHRRTK